MKKLIVFSVDKVLIDNEMGAFKDVLVLLGKGKEVQKIDEEYQKRKHFGPWGLEELAKLYKGFSKEKLRKVAFEYCLKNLMQGTKETIAKLRKKNYGVRALSSNPQFIMETLADILSLDFSHGTKLEFKDNIATGRISKQVNRYTKAEILKERMGQLNLQRKDVIIVGNSLTDLPMAEIAGFLVAFDAEEEVKRKADVVIKKKDLREILKHI